MPKTVTARIAARAAALACASLIFAAPALAQSPDTAHDGDWAGVLNAPGGQALRLVLHVKTSGGKTDAVLDSLDQDASIPASAYKIEGNKVSILFLPVGGELEGEYSADNQTLKGTWMQGIAMPLTLTRTASAPAKP
jgi:hypothetical protein